MSRFRPAPFGNAAANTVIGELRIAGALVVPPGGTVTGPGHILDTNTSFTYIDTAGAGSVTIGLPAPGAVPVGWTMTFKDIGPLGLGDSVRIRGAAGGQNIDGSTQIILNSRWESVTIRSTGVVGVSWLIIDYFNGTPPS